MTCSIFTGVNDNANAVSYVVIETSGGVLGQGCGSFFITIVGSSGVKPLLTHADCILLIVRASTRAFSYNLIKSTLLIE